ncbi:MAG: putative transport system ATP-binding protein [Solirubrobacterales bacterium]|nr:putative transport system ATP-binding protein [Solirubrobacterales bacterium]
MSEPIGTCRGISVVYGSGSARVEALAGIDLDLDDGEQLALLGRSGSGKTTLLHILGGLVVPSAGDVTWLGEPLSSLDAEARGKARARGIGYVFQGANLFPHLSAWENLAFAARATAEARPDVTPADPDRLLALVGLAAKRDALPAELSGGEAQRVAIARALAQTPRLLLCDEPTGHLDSDTGERVLDLIDALHREFGFALVTATHDPNVAARASRTVELLDGKIADRVSEVPA